MDTLPIYDLDQEYAADRPYIMDLPIELLIQISQCCRRRDIYSLALVNRVFHDVSNDLLYTLVTFRLDQIVFGNPSLTWTASLEEMAAALEDRESQVIKGLCAKKQRLSALRTMIILSLPRTDQPNTFLIQFLLCEILERAERLQTLKFKAITWGPVIQPQSLFSYVTLPPTITTYYIHWLDESTSSLLAGLHSLTTLRIQYITEAKFLDQIPADIGIQIEDFDCTWDIDEARGENCEDVSRRLAALMPNLRRLEVTYLLTSENRGVLHSDLEPEVREAYLILLRNLTYLEDVEFSQFDTWPEDLDAIDAEGKEIYYLRVFSEASPALRYVTFPRNYGAFWKKGTVISDKKKKFRSPSAEYVLDSSVKLIEEQEDLWPTLWTPDPRKERYWPRWFEQFSTPQNVRSMMDRCWSKELSIPSLDRLCQWHSAYSQRNNRNIDV